MEGILKTGKIQSSIVDLCKEFPQIGIRISIEGLEQTNNEIRGLQNGYKRGYGTLKKLREIGALSAGVATIPFAYSKKFKTMFGNLHYDYTIEARELDTEAALEQTQTYIREYKTLAEAAKDASKITKEKLSVLKKDMAHLGKTDM